MIIDGGKLRQCPGDGIVAFCLFPVEAGDDRWIDYLKRIDSELGIGLSHGEHTTRVTVPLIGGHQADIVIATCGLPKPLLNAIAQNLPVEPRGDR